jgi:epoxyqueuosine reductase
MESLQKILDELGITHWGYTEESLASSYENYKAWVEKGDVGTLSYLTGEKKEKREDLKNYFPEFQSALVFAFPYYQTKKNLRPYQNIKIASYVLGFKGKDYHTYLREKLNQISEVIKSDAKDIQIQFTLDTQPVLERDLAYKAGLGWFGKNSMLIDRGQGSYFIIGSLLLNQKLPLKIATPIKADHCGTCTACLEACPTDAISDERTIIAEKCISTFTIEHFKPTPPPVGFEKAKEWIFGCDICQEVCPWNEKKLKTLKQNQLEDSEIKSFFLDDSKSNILQKLNSMSNRAYRKLFKDTPA